MLLQRLCEYYEKRCTSTPSMYKNIGVEWIIDLDNQGHFLGISQTSSGKEKAKLFLAPHMPRTGKNFAAKLLCDNGEYVLGKPRKEDDVDNAKKRHKNFIEALKVCYQKLGNEKVHAVLKCLETLKIENLNLEPDFDSRDNITFRVDYELLINDPEIQNYWGSTFKKDKEEQSEDGKSEFECLVCGKKTKPVKRHKIQLKGIPGGQPEKALISSNKKAFESYGLEESEISPMCFKCAEEYAKAFNELTSNELNHIRIGSVVYIFWTKEEADFPITKILSNPESDEVKNLIKSAFKGETHPLTIKSNPFYVTVFSGSSKRAVQRDWIETTVENVRKNLVDYFDKQNIVEADGTPGKPLGLRTLAYATIPTKSKDKSKDLSPNIPTLLLRNALEGTPLPEWLLYQVVKRIKVESDDKKRGVERITRPRCALIKMVLLSNLKFKEEFNMENNLEKLELKNKNPAYLCGRLLCVLEEIQKAAIPGAGATLIDRYYGTASSAPATVFGNLMRGAQAHLGKLRKDKPRWYGALQKKLEDIQTNLNEFPKTLALKDQALFALGYYHQRADNRASAAARAEDKKAEQTTDNQIPIEEE